MNVIDIKSASMSPQTVCEPKAATKSTRFDVTSAADGFPLSRKSCEIWNGVFQNVLMEFRPYQQRLVCKTLNLLEGSSVDHRFGPIAEADSVLIESPIGSGKTVIGLSLARYLQQMYGWRIGWVAKRPDQFRQAIAENASRRFGVELQMISATDNSPPPVDCLIVDEAQHDMATCLGHLCSMLRPQKLIGLTATPFRTDRIKLCFDRRINEAGLHQLIQCGYLSPYHHYAMPDYRPERVAAVIGKDRARWGKSLIFFARHEECRQCRGFLAQHGIRSEVVTGTSDQARQLDDFQTERLDVLINMNIFTEGFDIPSLQSVFCRPGGRASTVQMAGRIFRKHPSLAAKQIVQCVHSRHSMTATAAPAEQYVWSNDQWESL